MPITYDDGYSEEDATWLACGVGKRDHMVLIEIDGEVGWCSNDRINNDEYI